MPTFLRSRINLALTLMAGFSASLVGLTTLGQVVGRLAGGHLGWLTGSALLVALATVRPVKLRPHVKVSLRTVPQLLAAVVLGPPSAMLAVGTGIGVGYLYQWSRRRADRTDLIFNAAEGVVTTGLGAGVYPMVTALGHGRVGEPLALMTTAASMHLCNALLIAGALAVAGQEARLSTTFLRLLCQDPLQDFALAVSGMVAAHLALVQAFWAVPLLLVPLALLERTLGKQREEAERERKLAVLAEVTALKNDFIAAVTHDLRTPLMVIKGFSELLAEREDELMDDERQAVACITLNSERLSELIEQLLQLSELDAGMVMLRRTPTDVPAVLRRVLEQLHYHAERKGVAVELTVHGDVPTVELDRARMEQVVSNLLGNAIKFTPPGGQVRMELGFHDEQVVLTIADSGPGIAPEVLPHVFERFYRAHRPVGDHRHCGGLGLAIAKSIVELHGGTIAVESRVKLGSTFTVRLPHATSTAEQPDGLRAGDPAHTAGLRSASPLPSTRSA